MLKNKSIFKLRTVQTLISASLVMFLLIVTTPFVLAADSTYKVEQVVTDGKESKETDAILTIKTETVSVMPDKNKFKAAGKEFAFSDIKTADYSYSKKPMLSGGGAIATALLVGFIFALPFLFIKKKNHWLSVQTEKEFAVIKLDGSNYRQIVAEFETHGVKVNTVNEEDDKKKEKK
jgi:hypothetical protein